MGLFDFDGFDDLGGIDGMADADMVSGLDDALDVSELTDLSVLGDVETLPDVVPLDALDADPDTSGGPADITFGSYQFEDDNHPTDSAYRDHEGNYYKTRYDYLSGTNKYED